MKTLMIIINWINAAVLAGTPLLLATNGEILTEKSGNLNLGVEGRKSTLCGLFTGRYPVSKTVAF